MIFDMINGMLPGVINTDPQFWTEILLPAIWAGFLVTLQLILWTAPFGLLIGIVIAVARVYGPKPLRWFAKLYVIIFRGCPLLVLLFILYFGLPSIGIMIDAFPAAVIGFILCNSAYNSEYIRGALQSIKGGQMTAARSLGMTKWQAIGFIIVPQAMRRAIPGVSNEFIYMIKYTSLAYFVTVMEMTCAAKQIALHYLAFIEAFGTISIFYLGIVTVATIAVHHLEKKVAIPGVSGKVIKHF